MTIGAAVSAQQFSPAEWTDGLLKLRADLTPRVNAVADLEGRSLSFKDLYSASSELAREIERSQDPPGLIAVTLPNCINAMVAAFAVFRSRHALLMVHPQLPNAARHPVFGRLHPVGEIVPDGSGLRIVREPYGPAAALWQAPAARTDLGIALCVLTSGSTGRPRIIAAPHSQVAFAASMIDRRLRYRAGDIVAVAPPLSFDYGLYQLLLATIAGATVLLDPKLGSGQGLASAIARCGASVLPLVPTMLRVLASAPITSRLDTSKVRMITTTGDLLTESDLAEAHIAFPGAAVVPMYGLSECKRVAVTPVERATSRPPGAVGMPLDGTDVTISNGRVQRLPNNTIGELVVAGPHLTLGYLGDSEATARRFAVDTRSGARILRTGDRMRQDPGGWLHWVGRASDIIKVAGYRLDPAEVETAAATCDSVIESGAYGRPDDTRGQVPVLVVRLHDGTDHETGRRALNGILRELLPPWAMPEVEIRDQPLPRTRNGKIDRVGLGQGRDQGSPAADNEGAVGGGVHLIDLCGLPTSRQFINCHTQAFMSAYEFPFAITAIEFEIMTTTPFGVRSVPDDPHRLLVPYLDPDIGLDRACKLLGLECETVWHHPSDGAAALRMLDDWLCTGPVVLGPLDLGCLDYHELAHALAGCDHYLVVLGRSGDGEFVVRDPEGFMLVDVDERTLVRAWAANGVREGRGAFTQRRLIRASAGGPLSEEDLLHHIAEHAIRNIVAAEQERTGGTGAYRALVNLTLDPTNRRALSLLLPAANYRYRLSSFIADRLASLNSDQWWRKLCTLFDAQLGALSSAHQELLSFGTASALHDAINGERRIAAHAIKRKMAMKA
jgi:acyl-CoA synthetase (AMP-forming)/AMP-acid ligase II